MVTKPLGCLFICLFCSSTWADDPVAPKLPKKFSASLVQTRAVYTPARGEASESDYVRFTEEYMDEDQEVAAIYTKEPLQDYEITLFNVKKKQIFRINRELGCVPYNWTSPQITGKLFDFSEHLNYVGTKRNVGGIQVVTWNDTETHDYPGYAPQIYINWMAVAYAEDGWKFYHCFDKTDGEQCLANGRPVQMLLEGFYKDGTGESPPAIVAEMDTFVDFVDTVDPQVFVPPRGVFCNGFSANYDGRILTLPNAFSLEREVYTFTTDREATLVDQKMWADVEAFVLRVRNRLSAVNLTEFTEKEFTDVVEDKINGYAYVFDSQGTCSNKMFTKPPAPIDAEKALKADVYQLIYGVNDTSLLNYIGKRTCRRGLCDVWVLNTDKFYSEIYTIVEKDQTGADIDVPVRIEKYLEFFEEPRLSEVYNYFNFDAMAPSWQTFSVRSCMEEVHLLTFQIMFEVKYSDIQDLHDFEKNFRLAVTDGPIVVFPTRVNDIMLDNIENTKVVVTATLYEDPYFFDKGNEAVSEHHTNQEVYRQIENVVASGNFEIPYKNAKEENMFAKAIGISKDVVDITKLEEGGMYLERYKKYKNSKLAKPPVKHVAKISLSSCVAMCEKELDFRCESFSFCRSTGECLMTNLHKENLTETGSFDETTDCDFYSKDYAFDYTLYQGQKLIKKAEDTQHSVQMKDSESCLKECSTLKQGCKSVDLCVDSKDKTKGVCIFHNRHMLEVSIAQVQKDANCIHFSRAYINDFLFLPNQKAKETSQGAVSVTIGEFMNVENCARECTLDPQGCTDFEMCTPQPADPEKTQCTLMRSRVGSGSAALNFQQSTDCDHYQFIGSKAAMEPTEIVTFPSMAIAHGRSDLLNAIEAIIDSKSTNHTEVQSEDKPLRYSSGSMAGLAIGMLVVGLPLGAGLMYFLAKRTVTSGSDNGLVMKLIGSSGL